jgi:pimeloyl-ACP methyl ester carboxylesterase
MVTGVVLLLAAGAVGWHLATDDPAIGPRTSLADQCGDVPPNADRVELTGSGGRVLGAALVGPSSAKVGVVLRQGASQTICDWLPWAGDVVAKTGARVLLFDRRGSGSSPGAADLAAEPTDLVRAVRLLRGRGVDRVVVVGSSMGNAVTFSALPDLPTPPCALVAISPVLAASGAGGSVDGRSATPYPRSLWVTWEEQNPHIVTGVRLIRSQARQQHLPAPHLHGVATLDHSITLVEQHADVRDFLLKAVRSCSRVTG